MNTNRTSLLLILCGLIVIIAQPQTALATGKEVGICIVNNTNQKIQITKVVIKKNGEKVGTTIVDISLLPKNQTTVSVKISTDDGDTAAVDIEGNAGACNGEVPILGACETIQCDGEPILICGPDFCVPTVSEWGLIVMCLMMLTAGTIVVRRRSRITH